jgi:hypothetical protein
LTFERDQSNKTNDQKKEATKLPFFIVSLGFKKLTPITTLAKQTKKQMSK